MVFHNNLSIMNVLLIFPFNLFLVSLLGLSFSAANEVETHNKPRQYYLDQEKFRVTQCGWIRSCTIVAIEMSITNCWKLIFYGLKKTNVKI